MSERTSKDGDSETAAAQYEPPVLVVIGNLRDLLAGAASQADDVDECSAGGNVPPNC